MKLYLLLSLCALVTIILVVIHITSELTPKSIHQSILYIPIPIEDRIDLNVEDRHNVHNVCLKRGAKHVIALLQNSDRHKYTIESTIAEIDKVIKCNRDATIALHSINHINSLYKEANIRENEVLRLVWERINLPENKKYFKQLISNLIEQLADCRNGYSHVHCCEGRVMRLLQTLECCDFDEKINMRPLWAYRDEISNTICKYRKLLLEQLPSEYESIDNKTDLSCDEKILLKNFNQCLIKNLNDKFNQDYIKTGLLTDDEIKELTKDYYDALEVI